MSKELEALKILKANAILFDDGTDFGASMLEALIVLDKALTAPTADEVCEALSKYYGEPIVYNSHIFHNERETSKVSLDELLEEERYDLITLIGRFYEGLETHNVR